MLIHGIVTVFFRYEEYDHIGYDVEGKKWMKQSANGEGKDRIDDAVDQEDEVDYMRTIYDPVNDRNIVLSDRDLEILRFRNDLYQHFFPFDTMPHSCFRAISPP